MYSWEVVDRFRQFNSRWFEPVDVYVPGDEHLNIYRTIATDCWDLRRSGMWYVAEPHGGQLPDQGWKIHVSASTRNTETVLKTALPVLIEQRVAFKFVADRFLTSMINGKLWPRGSAGKFITIYPVTSAQFFQVGERLAEAVGHLVGQYILSDRPWPNTKCVFYRYGGFRPTSILELDGTHNLVIAGPDGGQIADQRTPFWNPPAWAPDPFGAASPIEAERKGSHLLADGRFEVNEAISFSNRGGVYVANDRETGRKVILKEARPHVELGRHGIYSVEALEKEHRLLEKLSDTGYYARPIMMFKEWEHYFLAEEFVEGDHIGRFTIKRNPLYWGDPRPETFMLYYETMRNVWVQLAQAIAAAHERLITLEDLSFSNVMVDELQSVRIIDLEASIERGVDADMGLQTPGVSGIRAPTKEASDYVSLGVIVFGSVMLVPGITGFYPPSRQRFLKELKADLGLSNQFVSILRDLDPSYIKPVNNDVAARLASVPLIAEPQLATSEARDGVKHHAEDEAFAQLKADVSGLVDGVARYMRGTASPNRSDRLFPCDLTLFSTNPLSVAFGAAGTIYALNRMQGHVSADLTDWMLRKPVSNSSYPPGLYVGQAGVAWVMAELGYLDKAVDVMRMARSHPLLWRAPNIMYGSSGYGMCCLKLWSAGAGDEFLDDAINVGHHLLREAIWDKGGAYWRDGNNAIPLGYAFGGSGISLFLLYLSLATNTSSWFELGRSALEYEMSQAAFRDGRLIGFPAEGMDEPEKAAVLRCYWDIGSAGVVTTLVRYLAVRHEHDLRVSVPSFQAEIARKYVAFPQLFHGLAGLGNSLLDLWEYDLSDSALAEAWRVAAGIMLFRIEREEGYAFPGEQTLKESADFATGSAGIGLFLDRLLAAASGTRSRQFNFVVDELIAPAR